MGSIYARGQKLWMSYQDGQGKRHWKSTGFDVGQERDAKTLLDEVESMVAASQRIAPGHTLGATTLKRYGAHWLKEREADGIATIADERTRLERHIYPELGDFTLTDIKPRHVRALVRVLKRKDSTRGERLAPKRSSKNFRSPRTSTFDPP